MSGRVSPLGAVISDRTDVTLVRLQPHQCHIGATGRVVPGPVAVLRGLVRNELRAQRSFPRQRATSNQ